MNCHRVKSRLGRYLDGELPPRERLVVEQHVGKCLPCLRELTELSGIESLVQRLKPPPAPAGLTQRILAGSCNEPARAAPGGWIGTFKTWSRPMQFAAAGTALLALCVGLLLSSYGPAHDAADVAAWLPSASGDPLVTAYRGVLR
jgi:anti-sigma factor RsiW